jgi:hypothetical protein
MKAGNGKGRYNSSATRIRPFFEALVATDPTGVDWLPKLLALVGPQKAFSDDIVRDPGQVVKIIFETETQREQAVGPPEAFLRWLIQNPERMIWPRGVGGDFSPATRRWRLALMGKAEDGDPDSRKREAMSEGLRQLATVGARGSAHRWWAFEGSTKVDCFIETERVRLYVEGKRTEPLSSAINWFPERNQFARNLEAAREHAVGKNFACLLMSEAPVAVTNAQIADGLPHFTPIERENLLQHYLGNITWRQACNATGVAFSALPDTSS